MANQNQPSMNWHKGKGVWYTAYTCKGFDDRQPLKQHFFYFHPDEGESKPEYDRQMEHWRTWRTDRNAELRSQPPQQRAAALTISDIIAKFYEHKTAREETSNEQLTHLRNHLRRFRGIFESWDARKFDLAALVEFISAIKAYRFPVFAKGTPRIKRRKEGAKPVRRDPLANKTINHDIAAVKAVLSYGIGMGFIPPMMLQSELVAPLQLPEPTNKQKAYAHDTASEFYTMAPDHLRPWIALTWLTACRPSETVRLVTGVGYWCDEDGEAASNQAKAMKKYRTYYLPKGKRKTGTAPRWIVFSGAALKALNDARGIRTERLNSVDQKNTGQNWIRKTTRRHRLYTRADSFSKACDKFCGGRRPHFLRHGAAQYLLKVERVRRGDVDSYLGHIPSRVSRSYTPEDFQLLRETAAKIPTLEVVDSVQQSKYRWD